MLAEAILPGRWIGKASLSFDLAENAQVSLVRSWLLGFDHISS